MDLTVVTSLGAGSDKGETELRLPLRLLFGLAGPYVVLLWLFCGSCVGLSLSALPCLCLAFALSCLYLRPCLRLGLGLVFVFVVSSLLFSSLISSRLLMSCLDLGSSCPCLIFSCLVWSCVLLGVVWGHFLIVLGSFGVIFRCLGGRFGHLGGSWGVILGILAS